MATARDILGDSVTLDTEFEWVKYSPICLRCRHLIDGVDRRCAAFAAIPQPIWNGDNPHTAPYPGDGGIRFAARTN